METRSLGSLEVSVVGLGCNNFGTALDPDGTRAVVDAALEAGITYFDTAESYGDGRSEEFLGRALAGRRDQALVATKWGHTNSLAEGQRGGAPDHVRRSLEASLTRLGMDHVDHYQLHRPDPDTPVTETLGVLGELQAEGKIREIGCTAFSAAQLDEVAAAGDRVPHYASVQNHYSLLTRDPEIDGVLDACARHEIAFVPYFPLESGVLTGKYHKGEDLPEGSRLARWGDRASRFIDDERLDVVARLTEYAEASGHTMLDLAFGYLVSNPLIASVIAGATRPAQIRSNVAAAAWRLSEDELAEVRALLDQSA